MSVLRQPLADDLAPPSGYLALLGERVRTLRARRGMSRKILARDSGVSERYLAQLETGRGNISIIRLRQLAIALDTPLEALALDGPDPPTDLAHAMALLRRLRPGEWPVAHDLLQDRFGGGTTAGRAQRVALIGLRGGGKSTLGEALAALRGVAFYDLDREIERESGMSLTAIFDLYGQPAFRRLERRCLGRAIEDGAASVIAAGGGLVSDAATFEHLLAHCLTVWVKAAPAEHMSRVIAQGDTRPMSNNREAMQDLKRILKSREALYQRADIYLDTSGKTPEESLDELRRLLSSHGTAI